MGSHYDRFETKSCDDEMGFTAEPRMEDYGYRKTKPLVRDKFFEDITYDETGVFATLDRTVFTTGAQKDQKGKPRFDLIPPEAMLALAEVYALGAEKYEDRNWEKGIPFSACLGALKRHLNAFELGHMINTADGQHEHIAHVMWWAVALTTFIKRDRLDLNDLPHYKQ